MDAGWRKAYQALPRPLRWALVAAVTAYIAQVFLLALYIPRAPLEALSRINIGWILAWTLAQAALSATIAVALGAPVGVAAGYYGDRIAASYRVLGLPVFMAPSVSVVLGFRWLSGSTGLGFLGEAPWGIIAVHAYYNIPLAAVLTMASVRGLAGELVEYTESIGLRGWRLWRALILYSALPGALMAWILSFTYSFTGLAAPLMVEGAAYRYYTLEAWIYTLYWGFPGLRFLAVILALAQAGGLALTAYAFIVAQSRVQPVETGEAVRGAREEPALLRAYSALLLAGLYLPLAGVVVQSLYNPYTGGVGLEAYVRLLEGPLPLPPGASAARSMLFSLLYAGVTGAVAVALSLPAVVGPGSLRRLASMAPLVVSPVVAGVALQLNSYPLLAGVLGHSIAVVLLVAYAHSMMALPLASRSLEQGVRRVPGPLVDYLLGLGLRGWRLAYTLARAAGPGLVAAVLLSVVASLGEFGAALVVTDPSTWSLGVLVYSLYSAGRLVHVASAGAAILLSLTVAVTLVVSRWVREWF